MLLKLTEQRNSHCSKYSAPLRLKGTLCFRVYMRKQSKRDEQNGAKKCSEMEVTEEEKDEERKTKESRKEEVVMNT